MNQQSKATTSVQSGQTSHRFFANFYERMSRNQSERDFMEPLRREVTAAAHGLVLEIGAGNGLNFAFYDPDRVERIEAIEPDSIMLRYARERAVKAPVPINLTQASVERLPFDDASFDSAVVTLVFCSVGNPLQGLIEARRVLKPGGTLLMVEHVRARGAIAAAMQNIITPFTRLMAGNCHWNRNTEKTVIASGFQVEQRRDTGGFMMPMVVLRAVKF